MPSPQIKGAARILACQSNETCSSLTEWVTQSSSKPPAARSASEKAGCPDCTPPSCWAPSRRPLVEKAGIDAERGRAGHRRLRHPVRRAVQQHHPGRLADRGPARARRRHHGRLPVRQRPAGQPPDRRPDRGGRHRRRHRLRNRGDEPRRPGRQRRPGPLDHPRRRRGTSTCPTSSPPPSGSPSGAASPARTSTQFGFASQQQGQAGLGRGPLRPGDLPDRGAGARREQAAHLRAAQVSRDQGPARHHAGRPGRAQAGDGGRHPHRGHLVADLRRRGRRAVDGRRQGQGAGPSPAGPHRRPGARRRRAVLPPRRPGAVHRARCWRRPG